MRLTEKQKVEIAKRAKNGEPMTKLAKDFGVNYSTILWHVKKGPLAQKKKNRTEKPLTFVDVPLKPKAGKVVVLIAESSDVRSIIQGLL